MFKKLIEYAIKKPKIIIGATVILVILTLMQFPRVKVDTDPENMLPQDASVRVFHRQMKKEFSIYDFIVIGVVNREHPSGVFNIKTFLSILD